ELITRDELEKNWRGIVLLAEKTESRRAKALPKQELLLLLLLSALLAFGMFIILYHSKANLQSSIFLTFSIIGLIFSFAALKDLFGSNNRLLNDFCNITSLTDCSSVIGSNKWKLFKYINFSDLSITFFATQLLGLLLFFSSGNEKQFFFIQEVLLYTAVPIILLSIYFQRFIEKKWCPICIAIILLILAEITYMYFAITVGSAASLISITFYTFLLLIIGTSW